MQIAEKAAVLRGISCSCRPPSICPIGIGFAVFDGFDLTPKLAREEETGTRSPDHGRRRTTGGTRVITATVEVNLQTTSLFSDVFGEERKRLATQGRPEV